jgi:hypothetical protein
VAARFEAAERPTRAENGFQIRRRRARDASPPGVEIGIGGVTLIAESRLLVALRELLARLIGWAEGRRAEVDLALRSVRLAATRRESLPLCGDGVSIARLLHRHALGDTRLFVVCDPRVCFRQECVKAAPRADTVEGSPGAELVILPRHRSMGLPRYVHGHHPNPLRRGFDALRQKGYRLVGEVAKLLGVSENTVRRMEAEGVIPKARRMELACGRSVRAFTAKEVERIARSDVRERWRASHPGRWTGA